MHTLTKKERLLLTSALLLPVAALAVANLLPRRLEVEPRLNLLWALLAGGSLMHWLYRRGSRYSLDVSELVGLIFVLSLLFPVISANDDFLRQELMTETSASQCLAAGLDPDRQLPVVVISGSLSAAFGSRRFSLPWLSFGQVGEIAPVPHQAPALQACGNHSPPSC